MFLPLETVGGVTAHVATLKPEGSPPAVNLWRNKARPSSAVKKIAGKHADELKQRIVEMQSMVNAIENLSKHCHGDNRPDCPILEDLSKL